MTPAEYLNAAKAALGIKSDYALAQRFEVQKDFIYKMRNGNRSIPLIVIAKIAITLNIDPISIIADLESQKEEASNNEKRAAFWRSFKSRAPMVVVTVCTLAYSSIDFYENAPEQAGGFATIEAAIKAV